MAIMHLMSRNSKAFDASPEAVRQLDRVGKKLCVSQKRILSALVDWFALQSEATQRGILSGLTADDAEEYARTFAPDRTALDSGAPDQPPRPLKQRVSDAVKRKGA